MTARQLIHRRRTECLGYERDDGLWEIEGELLDTRGIPMHTRLKPLAVGEPLHHMRLTMIVDKDMVIKSFTARTEAGPTFECADINSAYAALEGLHIGPGFLAKARGLVGGVKGCTHITDMIGTMATTAMQLRLADYARRVAEHPEGESEKAGRRPWVIGTCHAYRPNGATVKFLWPRHYDSSGTSD